MTVRKLVFLTGTRADFGKIKSLLRVLQGNENFDINIFVTGMHMLQKYGYTCEEVENEGFKKTYKYINQNHSDTMDAVLAKTVSGFSDYIKETKPDMIIVHGDRVEALAGAIVGSLNNILVSHIEGGEVSGTVDELIRHSVSKLSHIHFVANEESRTRLIQLGEKNTSIFIIGSPDLDVMSSEDLPDIDEVKSYYEFDYDDYGVILFHPVTTELEVLKEHTKQLVKAVCESGLNYIVIYPNNDHGSEELLNEYNVFKGNNNFRVLPSMRFEYFLTLMKNAKLVLGNSSVGVREAPFYSVPSVNIGTRQHKRAFLDSVINCAPDKLDITEAISTALNMSPSKSNNFGDGKSAELFFEIISGDSIWMESSQKYFIDLEEV